MSLFFPTHRVDEWPRWYKALTISGKPAGLGFCCPKCHLHISFGVPPEGVFHCGAQEKPPLITALLPVRRLGNGCLPGNLVAFGFDDYEKEKPDGNRSILWT